DELRWACCPPLGCWHPESLAGAWLARLGGLVVSDGDEIADNRVADVGPALDHLLGRRPVLAAVFASAEDPAAAPASLHIGRALEQVRLLAPRVLVARAAEELQAFGREIPAAAALAVAEHCEETDG